MIESHKNISHIGIDFGTTNSLLVSYNKDTNEFTYLSSQKKGRAPISSTVWFTDNRIVVGDEARKNIHQYSGIDGHHFEKSIKLRLGTDYEANIFGEKVLPKDIASYIISNLRSQALTILKEDAESIDLRQAVFTVPIKFSGKARRDLRAAANKAGIEVTTFIHEPFAAVVGYYFTKETRSFDEIMSELSSLDGRYVLTFDWGGGTLDVTVVKIEDGKMNELGRAELTGLAGDKFDELIADWAWNKFKDKLEKGKYQESYLEQHKKKKWDKLLAIAEDCKIQLSEEEEVYFTLEDVLPDEEDVWLDELLTREEFSLLVSLYIDMALERVDLAIKNAGINSINIAEVLLTGGTCSIPAVQERMKKKFGNRVEVLKNANTVIAEGAAVISELKWDPYLTKDFQIELSNGGLYSLIEKGTRIFRGSNFDKKETFTCVDQRSGNARLIFSEGIDQKQDKVLSIMNIPVSKEGLKYGDEIYLKLTIDKDIVLTLEANNTMKTRESGTIKKTVEIYDLCFGLDIR